MSIEIDVLNGDASWPRAEPLMNAVWPPHRVEKLSWGHIEWAHADLRVLIDAPDGGLACHVGIYFRTVTWNGQKVHVGGIGGVSTREDCRGRGYASLALDAAVATMRANDAVKFELEGPAELIGDNPFALIGGTGAVWIRAKEQAGTVTLTATHPVLGKQQVEFEVAAAAPEVV